MRATISPARERKGKKKRRLLGQLVVLALDERKKKKKDVGDLPVAKRGKEGVERSSSILRAEEKRGGGERKTEIAMISWSSLGKYRVATLKLSAKKGRRRKVHCGYRCFGQKKKARRVEVGENGRGRFSAEGKRGKKKGRLVWRCGKKERNLGLERRLLPKRKDNRSNDTRKTGRFD